jgi:hypothetical protein
MSNELDLKKQWQQRIWTEFVILIVLKGTFENAIDLVWFIVILIRIETAIAIAIEIEIWFWLEFSLGLWWMIWILQNNHNKDFQADW